MNDDATIFQDRKLNVGTMITSLYQFESWKDLTIQRKKNWNIGDRSKTKLLIEKESPRKVFETLRRWLRRLILNIAFVSLMESKSGTKYIFYL